MLCCQVRSLHIFWEGCGAEGQPARPALHTPHGCLPVPQVPVPEPSLASHLFTDSPAAPPLAFGSHTHLRGGEAAVAAVQAASGRRAEGGFHNVRKALVTSCCVGGLNFTHRTLTVREIGNCIRICRICTVLLSEVPPESLLNL